MFERKSAQPIPHVQFLWRVARSVLIALGLATVSLAVGMIGYHGLEGLTWIDAFLNAAMILGGMGEIDPVKTEDGKLFAGLFALYSGLWLVASMGIILAPVFHRLLHRFHAERK